MSLLLALLACSGEPVAERIVEPAATPTIKDIDIIPYALRAPEGAASGNAELAPELEDAEDGPRPRRRRRGRRNKENTPAFASFDAAVDQNLEQHIIGDPRDGGAVGTLHAGAQAVAAQLAALGYVDGLEAPDKGRVDGVTLNRRDKTWPGYNLFTPAGQNTAYLFDMDGEVVHRWDFAIDDAWPGFSADDVNTRSYRRAELMPNGDLIVIWSGYAVARISKDSRLVWGHFLPVHHDLHVAGDGSVTTLARVVHARDGYGDDKIIEDFITWLSPMGAVEGSLSVLDAFEAYEHWDEVWQGRPKQDRDLFHTNSLVVLDQDWSHIHPAFARGNILTSMRHLEVVAIIDPEVGEVIWHLDDVFSRQHDPQVVDADGEPRLMIFDNQGGEQATSRILEYPLGGTDLSWSYAANPPRLFDTNVCGHAQRLPNGNTLINESVKGRAFEITREGSVAWEWRSSHRAGPRHLLARNNEFTRYDPLYVSWL